MEETPATLASRKRRRRILIVLAVLVGLPLALLGGAYLFVLTPEGSALVKRQVLGALEGALAGKLAVKQLGLSGDHLILTGLELYTPEGELVAVKIHRAVAVRAVDDGLALAVVLYPPSTVARTPRGCQ